MSTLACPVCSVKADLPPRFAGRSVPCPACGTPIDVPQAPDAVWLAARRRRRRIALGSVAAGFALVAVALAWVAAEQRAQRREARAAEERARAADEARVQSLRERLDAILRAVEAGDQKAAEAARAELGDLRGRLDRLGTETGVRLDELERRVEAVEQRIAGPHSSAAPAGAPPKAAPVAADPAAPDSPPATTEPAATSPPAEAAAPVLPPPVSGVLAPRDPAVEEAIAHAVTWLCERRLTRGDPEASVVFHALVCGGAKRDNPGFRRLSGVLLPNFWPHTVWEAALAAMAIAESGGDRAQWELENAAQFLVDNQSHNGRWDRGQGVPLRVLGPPAPRLPRVLVRRRGVAQGRASGDYLNSFLAALALRACAREDVEVELQVIEGARQEWERCQRVDGGWSLGKDLMAETSTGAMTAAGVASLVALADLVNRPWRNDVRIRNGLAWLDRNFTVERHPGGTGAERDIEDRRFFWYFALERAGTLFGLDRIGGRDWHQELTARLLQEQSPDGSWHKDVVDTSLAVLVLCRSARPPGADRW